MQINLGTTYPINLFFARGSEPASMTIDVRIKKPDNSWESVTLVKDTSVPANHGSIYSYVYTPLAGGWYTVSFSLGADDAYDDVARFYVHAVAGAIRGNSSSTTGA